MLNKVYGSVGKMTHGSKVTAAGGTAYNASLRGARGSFGANVNNAVSASEQAMKKAAIQYGKKPTRIAMGVTGLGVAGTMNPKSHESRTAYRGPMQTGRGVGRYA